MMEAGHSHHTGFMLTVFALVIGTLLTIPVGTARATTVVIPDSNLDAHVRAALQKPTGDISDTDMQSLTIRLRLRPEFEDYNPTLCVAESHRS